MAQLKVITSFAPILDEPTGMVVGEFRQGDRVTVEPGPDVYYWVIPAIDGVTLANSNLICAASNFEGATPTYPQFPAGDGSARYLCGINVIDVHQPVWDALARGCRTIALTGTGDAMIVGQIKGQYPDATILLRPRVSTWGQRPASAADVVNYWFYGVVPGCIHLAFNEGNAYPDGGADFVARCQMDAEIAVMVRDRGGWFAAGGWAMGNPNWDDPYVQQGLDILRPHYNAGYMGLNLHLYSPGMVEADNPATYPYYMTRWRYLFDHGGFNPALRQIVCDEHGIDNLSNDNGKPKGGFPAQGASSQDVDRYCRSFVGASASAGGQIVAATLFTRNNTNPEWVKYDVQGYLGTLDALW